MSYATSTRLGGHAFNHGPSSGAEAEYDRLRNLARQEHARNNHQLAAQYNKQASDYIFRENNAVGRVDGDTIDLHGQFVEEAEDILEQRIRYAQSTGQSHLHVIVGKGNHSPGHVQKLKPRVEQVCRELGLQYSTEHNAGRIYVNLQGGVAQMPAHFHSGAYEEHHPQAHGHQQPHGQPQYQQQQGGYPGQPQQQFEGGNQHQTQQQHDQNEEIKRMAKKYGKKYGPKILRKLKGECCVVM